MKNNHHNKPRITKILTSFLFIVVCFGATWFSQISYANNTSVNTTTTIATAAGATTNTIEPTLLIPTTFNTDKISANHEVQLFIDNMATKYQFDREELATTLDSVTLLPNIIATMQHPYEEQPWYAYQQRLVNQKRIDYGVAYWKQHQKALRYAERKYGVPASIIVAIVGIESMYGHTPLKYPVLNSLVTLSFAYPPRATFFKSELEHYLLLSRKLNINPKTIFGSYAGAIGLPQFMPSSYRKFAIAYCDHDKKINTMINEEDDDNETNDDAHQPGDLTNDTDDVIVSVANYLAHFGWKKNGLVAVRAKVTGKKYREVIAAKLKPQHTIAYLKKHYHVKPERKLPLNTKVVLIELQNEDGYEHWLGLHNFYVLSRYNGNRQYVMAVHQLAIALKHARKLRKQ